MSSLLSEEDLRLAWSVARSGSVGAAARELGVSQPSASQRLARMERRLDVSVFDRDTRGARPTVAGQELVRQAEHILGHLDGVAEAVRAATAEQALTVGAFASLASTLFPVLDELLGPHGLSPTVDHGDRMVEWVSEGTLDGAFIAFAEQLTLPRGVHAHRVGEDHLVMFVPAGVADPGTGRQPLRDRPVPYKTYDRSGPQVHARLAAQGGVPRQAATVSAALSMARRCGHLAVVPGSAGAEGLQPGERLVPLGFVHRVRLSLVTPTDADPRLLAVLPRLRSELGLRR